MTNSFEMVVFTARNSIFRSTAITITIRNYLHKTRLDVMRSHVLLLVFLFACPAVSQAALIVKGVDTTITVGGDATVYFTIESDAGVEEIDSYYAEFGIASGLTRLEFTDPIGNAHLSDPNYVFLGNSVSFDTVSSVGFPNNTYIASAFTADFSNDPVPASPDFKVLVGMGVTANTGLPPGVGDEFTITLTPSGSPFFPNFTKNTFSEVVPIDLVNSDFTAKVTVVAASNIVPEPSSLLVWSLFGGIGLVYCHRRRGNVRRQLEMLARDN